MLEGRGVRAVGISGGGPLDPERGVILSIPNLPGWTRVPIAAVLSEGFGASVYVENDANACAVAEWLYGAGQGATSFSDSGLRATPGAVDSRVLTCPGSVTYSGTSSCCGFLLQPTASRIRVAIIIWNLIAVNSCGVFWEPFSGSKLRII